LSLRTGLLLALLSLAPAVAAAAPALPGLSPDVRVDITADRLVSDEAGRAEADGAVRLTAGAIHVAADHATYDPELSKLDATGQVTLVSGNIAMRATRVSLNLATHDGVLEHAAMFEKKEPLEIAVAAAATLEELRDFGTNSLQVEADRLVLEPEGSLVAFDPTVTTCDCGDEQPPSWTVGASKAVIVPGASLRLHWPVLRVRGVPVGAFPYLSLPLQPRKTGFLPPRVSPDGHLGFGWEQDFFLVLGESYDATLGADYYTGDYYAGAYRSFRGPRARTEFRYAPRVGTYGRAYAAYARDLSVGESPQRQLFPADRWNVALDQHDTWGLGFSDRIALGLVSDRAYLHDFTDSVILRGEQTVRSTAWFAHRAGESLAVADAQYVQDLRGTYEPTGQPPPGQSWDGARLFGEHVRRPFQRLPGFAFDLVDVPAGPAEFDLRFGAERYDPVVGVPFDDVGLDGLGPGDYYYPGKDPGEDDGVFQAAGETSATTRLSLRPGVSVPITLPPYLSVVPYAAYRQQFYENDVGPNGERSWGFVGATARTELARSFGKKGRVRHAFGPRLELRRLIPVTDHATTQAFDDWDLGPRRAETQARAALWQRLSGRSKLGNVAFELSLGEDYLLAPVGERWEDFADADAHVGPARAALRLRFDPETYSTREVTVRTGVDFRYVSVGLDYNQLAAGASARLLAGPDELFGTLERGRDLLGDPRFPALRAVEAIAPGITVRPTEGLTIAYGATYLMPLDYMLQQVLGVSYTSPCHCWSVGFQLAYRYNTYLPPRFGDLPNFENFTITLGGIAL
jgi:LPS-assembly protein